jgi:hypothetical protein
MLAVFLAQPLQCYEFQQPSDSRQNEKGYNSSVEIALDPHALYEIDAARGRVRLLKERVLTNLKITIPLSNFEASLE